MQLLGLNEYQVESIEEQRKISILLFENMPFLALLLLIKADVIRCDVLNTKEYQRTVLASAFFSLLSLLNKIAESKIIANFYDQRVLFYFMNRMAALGRWYPYQHLIA